MPVGQSCVTVYHRGCKSAPAAKEYHPLRCPAHGKLWSRFRECTIEERWNLAMSEFCPGSEFVDEPEKCAAHIRQCMAAARLVGDAIRNKKEGA